MTASLTVPDIPASLHAWLQEQAAVNHRSVGREVIFLLDTIRLGQPANTGISVARLLEIGAQCANAPDLDTRSVDELMPYDAAGLPD